MWSVGDLGQAHYGNLQPVENLRRLIPAVTLIVLGVQTFFELPHETLGLKISTCKPPEPS